MHLKFKVSAIIKSRKTEVLDIVNFLCDKKKLNDESSITNA